MGRMELIRRTSSNSEIYLPQLADDTSGSLVCVVMMLVDPWYVL